MSRGRSRVAIYFDPDILKIMATSTRSPQEVQLLALVPIQGMSDAEVADEIKKHLRAIHIAKSDFFLSLARSLVTVKNLKLPTTEPEELASMVAFQITRLVPYPQDEIVYRHQRLATLPDGSSQVRIVIVPRKIIDRALSILGQAHIHPKAILPASETMRHLVAQGQTPRAVLEVDFGQTHLIFLKEGNIHFSRSIPIGMKDLDPGKARAASRLSEFLTEVEASMDLFPLEHPRPPLPLLILGSARAHEILEAPLRERLKTEIEKHEIEGTAARMIGEEMLPLVSLADLTSLCKTRRTEDEINLVPQDVQQKFERIAFQTELKKLALGMGLALLLISWVLLREARLEAKYLEGMQGKTAAIEVKASELEALKDKIFLLKEHIEHRGDCLNLMTQLLERMPANVHLKALSYNSNRVSLRGYAPALATVFELVGALEKSKMFRKVQTRYARQSSVGMRELAEFSLECTLESASTGEKNV